MRVEKFQKLIELQGVFKPRRTSTPIRELDVVQDSYPSIEVIENVFSNKLRKVTFLTASNYSSGPTITLMAVVMSERKFENY